MPRSSYEIEITCTFPAELWFYSKDGKLYNEAEGKVETLNDDVITKKELRCTVTDGSAYVTASYYSSVAKRKRIN